MHYMRADEARERGHKSVQSVPTPPVRRQAYPSRDMRTEARMVRQRVPESHQEPVYTEEYEEEQFYVYPPQRQPVRMPPQKPQPVREEVQEEEQPVQSSRRAFLSNALKLGGLGIFTVAQSALIINDVKVNQQVSTDQAKYGSELPPTFYTTAVVGHNNDSETSPSHFTAQNQNGHVLVFELPAGDPSKALVYSVVMLVGQGKQDVPVSLLFSDENGDGKPDMTIAFGIQSVTFANVNGRFIAPVNPGTNVNQ